MPTNAYLAVGALLFLIGASGFLLRRNIIVLFMCIELMLNGAALLFVSFGRHYGMDGHVFVFFIIALAAAEAAIGLSILIAIFRQRHRVDIDEVAELEG